MFNSYKLRRKCVLLAMRAIRLCMQIYDRLRGVPMRYCSHINMHINCRDFSCNKTNKMRVRELHHIRWNSFSSGISQFHRTPWDGNRNHFVAWRSDARNISYCMLQAQNDVLRWTILSNERNSCGAHTEITPLKPVPPASRRDSFEMEFMLVRSTILS